MFNKKKLIGILIITIIFFSGLFIRLESLDIKRVPQDEKDFFMDTEGKPYMYELDSYYNYRLTKNYIDHGYMGDKFIGNVEWDSYSYYPPGVPMDYPPLIVYLTSFIYTIINYFTNIPLLTVCFWLPAFIAPFAGVITYIFVKRFSDDAAGLTAGILVVLSPLYMLRTVPGWFDTDMFNVFFPILIVWLFMEALYNENLKIKSLISFASAFSMFLFSMAWNGWQYIFYLITLFTSFYIIWLKLKSKDIKNCLIVLLIFSISSSLLIFLTGFINFLKPFYGLLDITKLIGVSNPWDPWPNLYITISELQIPTLDAFILDIGIFLLFFGILGFLLVFRLMLNKKMFHNILKTQSSFFYLFLLAWLFLSFISIFKGARFIILALPPLAISSGIAVGILLKYLENFHKNKNFVRYLSLLLLILIIIPSFLNAYDSLKMLKPAANDDLWNSAEWIRVNTPEDAVVISDWSYGHLFTAISERPVSFDGRSAYIETSPIRTLYGDNLTFNGKIPNTSREYWISHAFSTTNETLSAGIFRMLATSGDYAYFTLENITSSTPKSVEILNEILGIDKHSAFQLLTNKYNFSEEQSIKILNYTHPTYVKPFVIVTYDRMIETGSWDFTFGSWDFVKSKGGNFTYSVGSFEYNKQIINSTNEVKYAFKNNTITWKNMEPYCIVELKNGKIKKRYINPKSNFCIFLLWDNEQTVVIDKKFENSLFSKLILEKINTTNFKSVYHNKKVTVWEIKKIE
jgi:dolichyl-diphosphooligosaccharide--protein glycosyltransferase